MVIGTQGQELVIGTQGQEYRFVQMVEGLEHRRSIYIISRGKGRITEDPRARQAKLVIPGSHGVKSLAFRQPVESTSEKRRGDRLRVRRRATVQGVSGC